MTELKELGDLAEDKKYFDREAYKKKSMIFLRQTENCENVAVKNQTITCNGSGLYQRAKEK